ncbi:hypothetical protein EV361DRAFT_571439 [Lentinula raphanica]|nr:hypothetical protein EV361DRAFT_571439 [Lentinula raphanica]
MQRVPLQDFFDYIMPPPPKSLMHKEDVKRLIKILEETGTIDVDHDRWSAFPVGSPAMTNNRESAVFQSLTSIWNDVVAAAKQIDSSLEETFGLVVNGSYPVYSDRGVSSRPHAFNKLYTKIQKTTLPKGEGKSNADGDPTSKDEQHFVYDIANPYRFSKTEEIDVVDDIVNDMEQVLARDPCRRFAFGTTITNRTTRLWFLSRASLLISTTFDLMTDRLQLVRLFLSLAFSSLSDMGWDSTMSFSHEDKFLRRQYKIEVDGQHFTTMDMLLEASTDNGQGRATRIWRVKDSGGHTRVLKDLWLSSNRQEEHKIREAILADASALYDKDKKNSSGDVIDYREELDKRLVKPLAYWRVPVNGQPDDTGTVMLGGYYSDGYDDDSQELDTSLDSPGHASSPPEAPDLGDRVPDANGGNPAPHRGGSSARGRLRESERSDSKDVEQNTRCHYRIVYEQYATTLYDERSLKNVFTALVDVIKALDIMHRTGWVHRDVSGGNVYWFADGATGLLGDFEYAIRMSEPVRDDVPTGTPYFMASEVISRHYIYTIRITERPPPSTSSNPFKPKSEPEDEKYIPPIPRRQRPFSHNPIHDLESIWWIIVFVFFFNEDESQSSPNPMLRQEEMNRLFHGRMDNTHRNMFFREMSWGYYTEVKEYLPRSFAPGLDLLVALADILLYAYQQSESTDRDKIDKEHFNIHSKLIVHLRAEKYVGPLSTVKLVHLMAKNKKRKNSEPVEMAPAGKRPRQIVIQLSFVPQSD